MKNGYFLAWSNPSLTYFSEVYFKFEKKNCILTNSLGVIFLSSRN